MNLKKIIDATKETTVPYAKSLAQIKKCLSSRDAFTVILDDMSDSYCFIPLDKKTKGWFGGIVWENYSLSVLTEKELIEQIEEAFVDQEVTDDVICIQPKYLDDQFFGDANLEIMQALQAPIAEPYYSQVYNWCKLNNWDQDRTYMQEFNQLKAPKNTQLQPLKNPPISIYGDH